jgi:hypothetical protein
LEEWIKNPKKKKYGVSIIWKGVLSSFPVIGDGLAWKIGNGKKFSLGTDPWSGRNRQHILLEQIVEQLRMLGFVTLNQITDPLQNTLWAQGWHLENILGIEGEDNRLMEEYIYSLRTSHIRLRDREDELVWIHTPSSTYTPKEGYIQLSIEHNQRDMIWWWKKLWK